MTDQTGQSAAASEPGKYQDSDWSGWPEPLANEPEPVFKARVEARRMRIQAAIDKAKANHAADLAQNADFQETLLDVYRSGIDRARANAELVQKAAGVVGTIYTAVLATAFSVSSRPLPLRGLLPAVFLGLAIALATAYLAYLAQTPSGKGLRFNFRQDPKGLAGQMMRVTMLADGVHQLIRRRSYVLRAGVLALAVGVAMLPIAFVAVPSVVGRSSPAGPDWPAIPASSAGSELAKIRYEAEVAEAARLRQTAAHGTDDLTALGLIGALGLLIVFGGAAVRNRRRA